MLDLSGQRFGKLTVIRRVPGGAWMCKCDCDRICHPSTNNLRTGNSTSCGCLREAAIRTHGMTNSPEYRSWKAMWSRCRRPHDNSFHNYGGRGITVADEWRSFEVFLRDMGRKPARGYDLDRIDNEKGYGPGNCRWLPRRANLNNRRSNRVIEYNGKRQTIAQWAECLGINYRTLNNRINRGWSAERAFTEPVPIKET